MENAKIYSLIDFSDLMSSKYLEGAAGRAFVEDARSISIVILEPICLFSLKPNVRDVATGTTRATLPSEEVTTVASYVAFFAPTA